MLGGSIYLDGFRFIDNPGTSNTLLGILAQRNNQARNNTLPANFTAQLIRAALTIRFSDRRQDTLTLRDRQTLFLERLPVTLMVQEPRIHLSATLPATEILQRTTRSSAIVQVK
jgi:hypothetical protein